MIEERFDIVDRNDKIIKKGLKESEIHINDDIIRVATIYLSDKEGKFYLAQRSPDKIVDPLTLEAPAHGRVNSGESYEDAVVRETQEELYISPSSFTEIAHYYYSFESNVGLRQHWKKLFVGKCDSIKKYNAQEIYRIQQFENIEKLIKYYETHLEEFSPAVGFDISHLKTYFNI